MPSRTVRRGATIIELLVVIGVIGVLFSISFPALMSVRSAAGQTKSLANARSIAITIDSYRETHGDRYPIVKANVAYQPSFGFAGGGIINSDPASAAWSTSFRWFAVIADFAPLDEHRQAWVSPGIDPTEANFPSYEFSNSFDAASRLWTPDFDGDLDVIHAVRSSQVDHPALKAMIWDNVMAYAHRSVQSAQGPAMQPTPIAFADLHAEARRIADAVDAFTNPLNDQWWRSFKLHNTPKGVAGFDFGVAAN